MNDVRDELELEPVRSALMTRALWVFVAAAVSTTLVVIVFDWELSDMVGGAALGTVVWAVFDFLIDVGNRLPRGTVREPPPGAVIVRSQIAPARRVILLVPLCAGLGWLADRWDLGAVFVPGQFLGFAAANLLGAVLVGRWERRHGRRALISTDRGDPDELYAT